MYSNILLNDFTLNNNISNEINVVESEEILKKIKVYVTGEVKTPGVIELEEGDRIEDAINMCNGVTDNANLKKVNLAYKLEDGQKLYIPNINDKEQIDYISENNGEGIVEENSNKSKKININTGDINTLMNLPGVGESLAQKIINYRQENGKFKNIEDLKNVSGIGDKKFESLKEYICI